jgi:Protein of unknown function (DUF1176)
MYKFFAFAFLIFTSFACHANAKPASFFSVSYDDWDVVCDNTHHCEAISFGDTEGLRLNIIREAGPNGDIRLKLTGSFTDKANNHLFLDEQHIAFEGFIWETKTLPGDVSAIELSNGNEADILRFLSSTYNHETLSIQENISSKKHSISLTGLNESLLAIDELQGRKNNQTALSLTARGKNPRIMVPRAPIAPTIKVTNYKTSINENEAKQLISITRRNTPHKECSYDREMYLDHAYALSTQKALVMLECGRGAYNINHRVFLVSRQQKTPQIKPLLLPSLAGKPNIRFLINATYDANKGILDQFRKYRGLSDCGNKARWAFDGNKFSLLEYREYELCKTGVAFEFPRFWHANISNNP